MDIAARRFWISFEANYVNVAVHFFLCENIHYFGEIDVNVWGQ